MTIDPSRRRAGTPPPDDPPGFALAMELADGAAFRAALDYLESSDERTLAEQMELTRIPAPPFGEAARGARFGELLEECAGPVTTDPEGNVIGRRPGRAGGRPLVVAAHLDTVFPQETVLTVTREGDLLRGPGIGDDGRGLAGLLALSRALDAADIRLASPLLLVGTVGEEGVGNLRGVRHLFGEAGDARDARGFVSMDGAGIRHVVTSGVGSRRYRLRITGPGGHSWMDWGSPNPVHALSRAVAGLTRETREAGNGFVTLSVGRIGGGISINAIPEEAWLELDTRSLHEAPLVHQEERIRAAVEDAVNEANAGRVAGSQALEWRMESLGHRPAGGTDPGAALVRSVVAATRVISGETELVASSTDANVPMSLGIPAATVGAGGEAGQAHTEDEWYRNSQGARGIARVLLALLVLDRLDAP